MIWGENPAQRKDYRGAVASMNNQASTGKEVDFGVEWVEHNQEQVWLVCIT